MVPVDDCATCGDPQSQHKGGKGGCRHCEFGCGEFVPEVLVERVEPVSAEGLAGTPVHAADMTPLITAEQLHAAETERDAARLALDGAREEIEQLRRGRSEATERALELAAELKGARDELSDANGRIRELACEVEQLGAQLEHAEQYARDLQDNGDVPAGTDALLDQADATNVQAITTTSTSIRELISQLREQLAEHERVEALQARRRELTQEIAAIDRQLAAARVVTDRQVRAWAKANGYDVNVRGRVSIELRAAYLKATTESNTEGAPTA